MPQKLALGGGALILLILPLVVVSMEKNQNESAKADTAVTWPTTPTAQVCGNTSLLDGGPTSPPAGAISVPAGDNSNVDFNQQGKTFWFAPGTHTLGTGQYSQIIPANNTTYIGAPGAIISGQGKNKYAFTGQATGVTIKYLTIQLFGIGETPTTPTADDQDEGVVNHDSGTGWTIQYNTMQYNGGAAVFLGANNIVSYNCLTKNAQYGFQVIGPSSGGISSGGVLDHNEISYNDTYDFEAKNPDCGCTGGGKFWGAQNITVTNNYVHDNKSVGLWADTNDAGFDVENNYISDNVGAGFMYEISYNALIKNNNFIHNQVVDGKANPGFPSGAIYISESGGDSRVPGISSGSVLITGNNFSNNWGGVTIYENANRYCSSSANSSSGDCTMVNPTVANLNTCANASLLKTTPYIDDCRWKSNNVSVTGNTFSFTPSAVDPACTASNGCGFNALISEYGTYPPYTAYFVSNNIFWNQNNHFANNTYLGPWQFQAWDQGNVVSWAQWTGNVASGDKCLGSGELSSGQCSGPFGQDAGSTFNSTAVPTSLPGVPTAVPSQNVQPSSASIPTVYQLPTVTPRPLATVTPRPTPLPIQPTATPLPVSGSNVLDSNTAGFEGSKGHWKNWYATSLATSTAFAHSGSHSLQVKVTAPYGWGILLNNWPGFAATPGIKTFSFWALKGTSTTGVTMQLQWINASGRVLQNNQVSLNSLTSSWQKAQATVTAPAGTTNVNIDFVNNAAKGTIFYLDDVLITN